jgi:hypothetical protein
MQLQCRWSAMYLDSGSWLWSWSVVASLRRITAEQSFTSAVNDNCRTHIVVQCWHERTGQKMSIRILLCDTVQCNAMEGEI